jgi:hypothetical protein
MSMVPARVVLQRRDVEAMESAIRERFQCKARWLRAWDVYLMEVAPWNGIVHEFELCDQPTADAGCFDVVSIDPAGRRHDVLLARETTVPNAEAAARAMLRLKLITIRPR